MLFNSYPFIFVFLPVVLVGYYALGRWRVHGPNAAVWWLFAASFFFYGYWNYLALPLLIASILVNYGISLKLTGPADHRKQAWLALGIVLNLAALFYYKYANFSIDIVNALLSAPDTPLLANPPIQLPIGISFFTFTQIVLLIESHQGIAPRQDFKKFALFVNYFPHLISGPLIHYKQIMPQLSQPQTFAFDSRKLQIGCALFAVGLAKKVFIADPCGEYSDVLFTGFGLPGHPAASLLVSWFGTVAYAFQLYFDFSGYSDMAIGISMMFGIVLPLNFNAPYKSTSIIEYWQRFHMSLTNYIGQYLYTPLALAGARVAGRTTSPAAARMYELVLPTLLAFFIAGIWHGANWTFLLFGVMHGVYLVVNHLYRAMRPKRRKGQKAPWRATVASWALTFICVLLSFVMFRSKDLGQAFDIYRGMFGFNPVVLPSGLAHLIGSARFSIGNLWGTDQIHTDEYLRLIGICLLIVLCLPSSATFLVKPKQGRSLLDTLDLRFAGAAYGLLFAAAVVSFKRNSPFLYFQF